MTSNHRIPNFSASGTTAAVVLSLVNTLPTLNSVVLVAVGFSTLVNSVTSIVGGAGTFVKIGSVSSSANSLELWYGYNFGTSYPSSITVNRTAGTANMVVTARVVDIDATTTAAPTFTLSAGGTATSTAADPGTVTPAVGDQLFAAQVMSSTTTDSTARTSTGNTYLSTAGGAELTNVRVEMAAGEATAAVPSKVVWTVGSTTWASIQAMWTPAAAPAAIPALLVKGLTTAAQDAASVY